MGGFIRRNRNGWRRCGFCGKACRGQAAHLEHIKSCDVLRLSHFLKVDDDKARDTYTLDESLTSPFDFVFRSTSTLKSQAKDPAPRLKKTVGE